MAFSDMNDVEQELGEEKPPERGGNRTFLIIAGTLAGIMVLALLCIGGLALFRYLPSQRAAQSANATNATKNTAVALSASQTAFVPTSTATQKPSSTPVPTYTPLPTNTPLPTKTRAPTNTPLVVLAPTNTSSAPTRTSSAPTRTSVAPTTPPTTNAATATRSAQLTQSARQASATPTLRPSATALPQTGIGDELGTPGLITAAFVLVVIIFLMRRLRTAS